MTKGMDNLKHIVVLMMENRSFDHMLGALMQQDPRINGLTGNETNPDSTGQAIKVEPLAAYQGQLDPDPDHHFPGVNMQLFGGGGPTGTPSMNGFIKSYFEQRRDVNHSHKILYYFPPARIPILTGLASNYAIFNGWFASIPGPTLCNRAFAHYGTSFGQVGMNLFYLNVPYLSIYERMIKAGRTSKLYYFDQQSSSLEVVNLLKNQPRLFGLYEDFLSDCQKNRLPDYSFVEPNYSDHEDDGGGELLASDQHPDHHVLAGEAFIGSVYNAIRNKPNLWKNTLLLITYDEHGGIYDHQAPPSCTADGFEASAEATGTGFPFKFDRLGVRVPAIAISPWIPKGTVIAGPEAAGGRVFEHASIPNTVMKAFALQDDNRSPREKAADTFLDLLSDTMRPDGDCVKLK
ncbi:MAG TPA: alkaline phosphatase family protein [Blastocatellia bacterium]|nr:alkaline phosphatase family protein [Blastocatellia bacterium]